MMATAPAVVESVTTSSDSAPEVQDYRYRRGAISTYGRAVHAERRLRWLLAGFAAVVLLSSLALFAFARADGWWLTLTAALSLICVVAVYFFVHRHFIAPDLALRKWVQQLCDGEFDAEIELSSQNPHQSELAFHTRNLSAALNRLSTEMEDLVSSQTRRLAQQNQSLDLLFHLANDVAHESDHERVFDTVCSYLAQWFGDASVSAWMATADGLQAIATQVAGDVSPADKAVDAAPAMVNALQVDTSSDSTLPVTIRLPFAGTHRQTGIFVIRTRATELVDQAATKRLLNTVAEQVGQFVDKQKAIDELRETQLVRDRIVLAAEMHDSLAQTLAALRYQVTLLQESSASVEDVRVRDAVARILATVSEANSEVRSLISEYRKPLGDHRYAESIRVVVDEFRRNANLQVFFQADNPHISFSAREEAQLQRIIGEALNNAAKYASASMVRVFLGSDATGARKILIEDDGIGFDVDALADQTSSNNGGNHIGLSIMRERAMTIGGTLEIESDPGEGTRVSVELPPPSQQPETDA
jgi:two-component system nitrate/nitrite sensor histidine kinase NarX